MTPSPRPSARPAPFFTIRAATDAERATLGVSSQDPDLAAIVATRNGELIGGAAFNASGSVIAAVRLVPMSDAEWSALQLRLFRAVGAI